MARGSKVNTVSRVNMAISMVRTTMVKTISTRSLAATRTSRTAAVADFSSQDINSRLERSSSWRRADSTDSPDSMDSLGNKEMVPIYTTNTIIISIRNKRRKQIRSMMRS